MFLLITKVKVIWKIQKSAKERKQKMTFHSKIIISISRLLNTFLLNIKAPLVLLYAHSCLFYMLSVYIYHFIGCVYHVLP